MELLRPATKFLNAHFFDQFYHVESELHEVHNAYIDYRTCSDGDEDEKRRLHKVAEELVDVQMSCETALAILGLTEAERDDVRRQVISKNEARGYYKEE